MIQPTVVPPRDGEIEEIEDEPPTTRASSQQLQPGDQRVIIEKAVHKYAKTSANPWGSMTQEEKKLLKIKKKLLQN
ncbi:MAG: hypothetical protein Q8829_02610 [Candidatus Phytoplasma australasiaticum]|nr:hypothetical protein [Candidatus Phytoplasma australasiaticum]